MCAFSLVRVLLLLSFFLFTSTFALFSLLSLSFLSTYSLLNLSFSPFLLLLLLLLSRSSPSIPAGLIISLQLLRGDMDQVRRENPLIFSRGVAITRKLGFPDVIMPGESARE